MTRFRSSLVSLLGFIAALSISAGAYAHPGHGTTNPSSPAHLLEPVHFVTLIGGICTLGLVAGIFIHRRIRFAKAVSRDGLTGQHSHRQDD